MPKETKEEASFFLAFHPFFLLSAPIGKEPPAGAAKNGALFEKNGALFEKNEALFEKIEAPFAQGAAVPVAEGVRPWSKPRCGSPLLRSLVVVGALIFIKNVEQPFALSAIMRNFAAVNTKTRRLFSSWVLLAVFVPMVLLSSVHVHTTTAADGSTCAECVQHQCHGHLTALSTPIHACVLCQFVSLGYVAAAVVVARRLLNNVSRRRYAFAEAVADARLAGVIVTRGPPAA